MWGCATNDSNKGKISPRPAVVVESEPEWRQVASDEDADRLARAEAAWNEALAEARAKGFRRQIQAEGRILDPAAALPRPAPSPGSYMCRLIRIGAPGPRARAFTAFKPFFCYVGTDDGGQLSITKQTGTQRPGGFLWEDADPRRMIFLGSMALGNEDMPKAYGEDPTRDMAGFLERVGPLRFRLVIPWPRSGAKLDLFELTPAPVQNDE